MELSIFQVDAFAGTLFRGNPAAVIPLTEWLPDNLLQNIAMENNLSETAFFIPEEEGFHLRWFTPKTEVNLCGHATLATAHVLFNHLGFQGGELHFQSRSGLLTVSRESHLLFLDFPAACVEPVEIPEGVARALGQKPLGCWRGGEDLMVVFEEEKEIQKMAPDFARLGKLPYRGIIVTAPGVEADFVSRFFAPAVGVAEDPVTGSAHTALIPYWARRLGKEALVARQVSQRGGSLFCRLAGDRVQIGGTAVTYSIGTLFV